MLSDEHYPYVKVFFDTMDRVHVVSYTTESIHGHSMQQSVGEGLIDFVELDLSEYQKKISEVTDGKSLTPENTSMTFQQLRDRLFDIAELLKGRHAYLYFFLVGTLNNILMSPVVTDKIAGVISEELPEFWRQLNDCFTALRDVIRLQDFCREAVHFCLDEENLSGHSAAERYVGFLYQSPAMNRLVFQSGLAIMPRKDGKLDFDRVREINCEEIKNTTELLRRIQEEQKGVSFLRYYRIGSLEEMLLFEFTEILRLGYTAKKCRACGKYFLQLDGRKRYYCDRIDENGRPCRKRGGKQTYLRQVGGDPYLKKYKQVYEKIYSRRYRTDENTLTEPERKAMSRSDFLRWSRTAREARKEYLDGKISGKEMLERIDSNPNKKNT